MAEDPTGKPVYSRCIEILQIVFAALLLAMVVTACLISQLIQHINQFEEALRESEERMRIMFESINAGIVLVDCATRTIEDINPAALRMYGGAKHELIGQSCWDGSGYPDGAKGDDISLYARVMAIADVYDTLTSNRCYRPAMPHEEAYDIIVAGSGTQFDPALVAAFDDISDEFLRISNKLTFAEDNDISPAELAAPA